jgi:ferric-dicitrate binding protein FerR (iron transport regulator)
MKRGEDNYVRKKVDFIVDYYFSDQCDERFDSRIRRWLADPRDREAKDEALERIWNQQMRRSEPDLQAIASLESIRRRLALDPEHPRTVRKTSGFKFYHGVAAAAVVLCVAAGALLLSENGRPAPQQQQQTVAVTVGSAPSQRTIIVAAGERKVTEVSLPDGSMVWLHREASVSYPEDFVGGRRVEVSGEAYFSVVEQDGNPFFVSGEGVSLKVLGTEFMVRTASEGTESSVEVASGSVEVTVAGETHTIGARERLVYSEHLEEVLLSRLLPEEDVAAWKTAELAFRGQTLEEVFDRVSDFYGVAMAIDNALPVNARLTVQFSREESLEDVLYVLSHISSFDYTINNQNVTITKR